MKIFVCLTLALFFFVFTGGSVCAQQGKLTVILLRHAEKDSTNPGEPNPELSAAGKQRAERLIEAIGKYKPDLIYSTKYKRTRATALPLAETVDAHYRIPVWTYDFDKPEEFAAALLNTKARTIVVVGHRDTTPALANLLVKADKYKTLDEAEYDKIWIVEIKRNKRKPHKIKAEVIKY